MFAGEYSRQPFDDPWPNLHRLEGSFSRGGKATLGQTKTGAISPTGDWRAAAKSGNPNPACAFSLHFHYLLRDKKKTPEWGPNFAASQSQTSGLACVCNVPCNILTCVGKLHACDWGSFPFRRGPVHDAPT